MLAKNTHKGHYISLVLILVVGFLGLIAASSNKTLQVAIVVLISLFYVTWGIFHHSQNHSLNSKIVVEYILIAALGLAALLFFITGAFYI